MKIKENASGKAIVLANYLPQFHPIPENDKWWGKGFTEWTNVRKAKPLFLGHKQPILPGELGYYDLRDVKVREKQSLLANNNGITGFAYWHYWFGNGRQLLEKPFDEVLESKSPSLPFCLAWANESWTGVWHGLKNNVLMEQQYPGKEDYINHFNHVLKAFQDKRYIKIGNKPLFIVYLPHQLPNARDFTDLWNELAIKNGFDGMYFIGIHYAGWDHVSDGFDLKSVHPFPQYVAMYELSGKRKRMNQSFNKLLGKLKTTYQYKDLLKHYDYDWIRTKDCIPSVLPNWDNTPRSEKRGWVIQGSTPDRFGPHFKQIMETVVGEDHNPHNIVMIKSWNEWAEGNYIEPDKKYGQGYLKAIKNALDELKIDTHYGAR